jgi:hypothetical protein
MLPMRYLSPICWRCARVGSFIWRVTVLRA